MKNDRKTPERELEVNRLIAALQDDDWEVRIEVDYSASSIRCLIKA